MSEYNVELQDGIVVGGGSSSTIAWLPTVDDEGNLSWERSATTTPPETENIKGADGAPGADGQDGQDGADGKGIASIAKTSTSGNVDTYTITYTDSTSQTYNVTNGVDGQNGQDGAPGQDGTDGTDGRGVTSVAVNASNHVIVSYSDSTSDDAGAIDVTVPIDDTTAANNKVYSSAKVEDELNDCEADVNTNKLDVSSDMILTDITSQNPVYHYANENLAIMEDKAAVVSKEVTLSVSNGLIYANGTATGTAQITINCSVPESLKGCPVLLGLELVSGTSGKFTIQMPVTYIHSTQGEVQATVTTSATTLQGVTVANTVATAKFYCSSGVTATNAVFRPYLIEETFAKRGASTSGNPTASRTAVTSSLSGATGTLRCMTGSYTAHIRSKVKYGVLFGKRLCLCGDSIAQGNQGESFGRLIAQNENMSFENHAIAGATLSTYQANINIQVQVAALTGNYDYILVEGGINDRGHSVSIGSLTTNFDDVLDGTTVIGGTEIICKSLIEHYPNAKKLFVLCHKVTNNSYVPYANQATYFDAIISALEKWNIPYIDLRKFPLCAYNATYASTYFNPTNFSSYGGLHPTTDGYKLGYVDQITAKMKEL